VDAIGRLANIGVRELAPMDVLRNHPDARIAASAEMLRSRVRELAAQPVFESDLSDDGLVVRH
jgi:hypothetical protein